MTDTCWISPRMNRLVALLVRRAPESGCNVSRGATFLRNQMNEIMIDLETLGCGPRAVVLSIGAVVFDVTAKTLGEQFYARMDTGRQSVGLGRTMDESTIAWWTRQSAEARKVFDEQGNPGGIHYFLEFVRRNKPKYVWGNGSSFDITIIESLIQDYGFELPWKYNAAMDLRTFKRFMAPGAKIENKGTAHNALDDAIAQAQFVLDNCDKV